MSEAFQTSTPAATASCDWVEQRIARGERPSADELDEHVAGCFLCQARLAASVEPATGWRRFGERQPWTAVAIGVMALLPFTGTGMLVMLVQALMRRDPAGVLLALLLALITVVGGAMGGLVWNAVAPMRQRGRLAHDLSYAFVIYAYLLGVFTVFALGSRVPAIARADDQVAEAGTMLATPSGLIVFLALGLLFGFVLGRSVRGGGPVPTEPRPADPETLRMSRILTGAAIAVSIAALLWVSFLNPETRANRHLDRGFEHQEADRFEEALEEYSAAARLMPDDAAGHHGRGWALYKLRRFDEAIEAYEIAVRLRPDIPSIHTELAAALGSARRYEEAAGHALEATRLDESDLWAHRLLAESRLRTADAEPAIAAARNAIRLDERDPAAHEALARALLMAGRYREAESAYRETLERKPDWAFGWVQLARLAHQRRDFALADSAFTHAARLAPDAMARSEADQEMWRNVQKALATGE